MGDSESQGYTETIVRLRKSPQGITPSLLAQSGSPKPLEKGNLLICLCLTAHKYNNVSLCYWLYEYSCLVMRKFSILCRHIVSSDQPIDEIGLDLTSRLGEIQAKVMCCPSKGRSQYPDSITRISSSPQHGSQPTANGLFLN